MDCVMLAFAWPNWALMLVTGDQRPVDHAVSAADEGRGVPAACLAHLFLKFSRMQSEEQGGDTGLGLAISNRATRRR